jgi:protease-4
MEMLDAIENDDTVVGVILAVNSPGGGVYESAQIKRRLDRIQQYRDIPLYVSFGSMAASGGYYISAGADMIFAPRETLTGSIGVIFSSLNFSGLFEEHGISDMSVTSGEHKDIFSSFREMTDEERAIMQSMVDNSQDAFVSLIAEGRGMSEEEVRVIADGRIYDGIQAKEIGLIDEFGYLEDVIQAMRRDLDIYNAQVFTYEVPTAFPSLLGLNLANLLGIESFTDSQLGRALDSNSMPRLMYLAPAMVN